jgi:hypothetical protein
MGIYRMSLSVGPFVFSCLSVNARTYVCSINNVHTHRTVITEVDKTI